MPIDSGHPLFVGREKITTAPASGGGRRVVHTPKPRKVGPTPVTIVGAKSGPHLPGPTRLGTPAAFLMLAGLALAYFALHGWDKKYGAFGGSFAGVGSPAVIKAAADKAAKAAPVAPVAAPATATPNVQLQ